MTSLTVSDEVFRFMERKRGIPCHKTYATLLALVDEGICEKASEGLPITLTTTTPELVPDALRELFAA